MCRDPFVPSNALRKATTVQDGASDPWELDDPWTRYQSKGNKQAKLNNGQADRQQIDVDFIAQQVERRVSAAMEAKTNAVSSDDVTMEYDNRIQDLEERLTSLASTVSANHQSNTQQSQELANRIHQVQSQVEQQGQSLQTYVDKKFQEQLGHIEQLLTQKKARHE